MLSDVTMSYKGQSISSSFYYSLSVSHHIITLDAMQEVALAFSQHLSAISLIEKLSTACKSSFNPEIRCMILLAGKKHFLMILGIFCIYIYSSLAPFILFLFLFFLFLITFKDVILPHCNFLFYFVSC